MRNVQTMQFATAPEGWTARRTTTRHSMDSMQALNECLAVQVVRAVARAEPTRLQKSLLPAVGPKWQRHPLARPTCCGESQNVPRDSPWSELRSIQQVTHASSVLMENTTSLEAHGLATILHPRNSANDAPLRVPSARFCSFLLSPTLLPFDWKC